jgi:thiamine pyrophosphate-dependent acetolactate synthase large subunit-like protein
VGLDFNDPELNLEAIARGFGARTAWLTDRHEVESELAAAKSYAGPTFLLIKREP